MHVRMPWIRSIFAVLALTALVSGCSSGRVRPYSLESRSGVWWLVDSERKPFFSLGVCVVDQGAAYDPVKPAYSARRFHASAVDWASATLRRLRSWGFTTAGGWSDVQALRASGEMDLALTPVLGAGMEAGAPWLDLWDPEIVARIEARLSDRLAPSKDYDRLVGYYTDNEMGWWNGALFKMTLEHPARSRQRQLLVKLLRETYSNDWQALLRDHIPEGADSFDALEEKGVIYLRPGGNGIRVAREFLGRIADRYYALLSGLVRRHCPLALNLGDRYQSFYYPEVALAARPHVDVVSTNLNAQFDDGSFCRFFLDTLHELTGKPILVSEIYMCATENSSGNPNDSGLFPVVATQKARSDGLRTTLAALARLPQVIGVDWFQYYDEPPGGRFDGENFNFGLIDIENHEYESLTSAFRNVDVTALHSRASPARADASRGVPPAPPDPLGDFKPNRALRRWDRERGFVAPSSSFPLADLHVAWEPEAFDLGLFALDAAETAYYQDGKVPEVDRMEWTIELDGLREPIRLRLGAGEPATGAPEGVEATCLSGKELSVRVVAAVRVPAGILGRARLAEGDTLRLKCTLTTHARAYRVEWNRTLVMAR